MTLPAKLIGYTLALCAFAALCTTSASAQNYPAKTIEWVVPYPAGGGSDVVARAVSEAMARSLMQPIIINNKPGAATNIGADYVAHAKPDGYTILTGDTATLAANPSLYAKLSYSAEKDLTLIGLLARFPMILVVNPTIPVKNLTEFVAWANAQKDSISYASPGAGSPHHLTTELFAGQARLKLVHVAYKGAAPAVQDVVGGQVPFMFVDTASGMSFINAGRLRPIAIASLKRVKNFDTIATLDEQGLKGFEAYAWQGLVAPAATPADVIAKLNTALVEALKSSAVQTRFLALGLEATPSTPTEMSSYARSEREKWSRVIRASGIKLD